MATIHKDGVAASITVHVPVTWRRVSDLICTGLEGGYSGWLHDFKPHARVGHRTPVKQKESPWYCDAEMLANPEMRIYAAFDKPDEREGAGRGRKILTRGDIAKALELMARKFPCHFNAFYIENEDAFTGDVFLQCLVLGDIVYG